MWIIARPLVNRILAHAQRSAPRECVGVLSGRGGRASGWHPLTNVAEGERCFLADPTEQIRLFERLRAEGLEVVAIYHSHPAAPAEPSERDVAQAWHPGVLHLIVSLDTGGRLELNGFLIHEGQSVKQELTIAD